MSGYRRSKPSLRASTFDSYRMIIETRIVPHVGQLPVQKLTAPKLNQLYGKLLEGDDDRKALSARPVRYTHAVLRHALQDAIRWNRVSRNVADSAEPPSAKAAKAKVSPTWDRHQLRQFLEAEHVRKHRLYALWRLVATTGTRRGEALALTWPDLDLEAGRASVTDSKTESGRRLVALDEETSATLRAHRKAQAAERLAMGPAYEANMLVFCREDGEPLLGQSVSRTFGRLAKKAGLPQVRFHDLRHGHATLALQAGVNPKVVQERLGHSSVAFTLDRYSHAIPALQEDAAAKVAALLD